MSARTRVALALGAVVLLIVAVVTAVQLLPGDHPTNPASSAEAAKPCVVSPAAAASCGPWWGMAQNVANADLPAAVAGQEAASTRRLDIVHTYHRWYDSFPTAAERSLADGGRLLFLNWEPTDANGNPMAWSAIAAGAHDAEIDAVAAKLKTLPTVLLSFSHEPEYQWGVHGNAADFVAAFRHLHDRLTADGVTNVRYVWDLEGLSDPVWLARYASLWPGASYVDWIAWDPYNWASCRTGRAWQSFSQIATPFYQWLENHGYGAKPFMLAEYGTVEKAGDPNGKATWLADIPSALSALPNLRALVYFDVAAPPANCNWQVSTSTEASAAFRALAVSSPFRPTARLQPGDTTTH